MAAPGSDIEVATAALLQVRPTTGPSQDLTTTHAEDSCMNEQKILQRIQTTCLSVPTTTYAPVKPFVVSLSGSKLIHYFLTPI
jgi:hypothetical protein